MTIKHFGDGYLNRKLVKYGELMDQQAAKDFLDLARNHYWTKLRSRWVNRLKFPSIDEARARATKAEQLYLDLSALGDIDAAKEMFITMLTHLARARLLEAGIFPASRPELVKQLQGISDQALASKLEDALQRRWKEQEAI